MRAPAVIPEPEALPARDGGPIGPKDGGPLCPGAGCALVPNAGGVKEAVGRGVVSDIRLDDGSCFSIPWWNGWDLSVAGRERGKVGDDFQLLTKRARLARAATTAAAETDASSVPSKATASTRSRSGRRRAARDSIVTNRARSGTPVGGDDSVAEATSHAGTRSESRQGGTASVQVDWAVIDAKVALGLEGVLLPPRRVSVEETQGLLRGLVMGHLMFVLTTLLGESTGTIVNPLITIDLLAARTAAAATVMGHGTGRSGAVETTSRENKLAASRARRVVDDGVDSGLLCEVVPYQPSELSCWSATVGIMR